MSIPKKNAVGVRHYQFMLMFFTILIPFAMRTSLSVGIISMIAETPPDGNIPTYPEWDNIDVILSSFSWGIVVSQIGAGKLPEIFGPKWVLVISMAVGSITNMLIPLLAGAVGSTGVIICRVIQGFTQGFLYPACHGLISTWSPVLERSRVASIVYSGGSLGTALALPVTGGICGSKLGWPVAFYILGAIGIIWSVIFAIFARNSPEEHSAISEQEKAYIQSGNTVTQSVKRRVPTPWLSIATSLPFWAILVTSISEFFASYTLLTEMPTYMANIMDFDIKSNSALSSLPYFTFFILGPLVSPVADKLVENKILTLTTTRKVFNSLASFLPAAALIYLAFIDSSQHILAVVLLTITVSFTSLTNSGYMVNIIDIAPNHAGTLVGLINGTSNIFSILAPLTVGFLGDDKKDPILWRKVFLLTAGVLTGCCLFYDFFTSAKLQPWNEIKETEKQTTQEREDVNL